MKVTSSWYLSGASMCTNQESKEKEIEWGYLCNLPSNNPTDGGAHGNWVRISLQPSFQQSNRWRSTCTSEMRILTSHWVTCSFNKLFCETCRLMSIYCHKWHFLLEGCASPLIADVRRQPVSMWLCTQQINHGLWDEKPTSSELWAVVCGHWCSPVSIVWERGLISSPLSLSCQKVLRSFEDVFYISVHASPKPWKRWCSGRQLTEGQVV